MREDFNPTVDSIGFSERFVKVRNTDLCDPSLRDEEFRLLVLLQAFDYNDTNHVYPTQGTLAADLGESPQTISRGVTRLMGCGRISKQRENRLFQTTTTCYPKRAPTWLPPSGT